MKRLIHGAILILAFLLAGAAFFGCFSLFEKKIWHGDEDTRYYAPSVRLVYFNKLKKAIHESDVDAIDEVFQKNASYFRSIKKFYAVHCDNCTPSEIYTYPNQNRFWTQLTNFEAAMNFEKPMQCGRVSRAIQALNRHGMVFDFDMDPENHNDDRDLPRTEGQTTLYVFETLFANACTEQIEHFFPQFREQPGFMKRYIANLSMNDGLMYPMLLRKEIEKRVLDLIDKFQKHLKTYGKEKWGADFSKTLSYKLGNLKDTYENFKSVTNRLAVVEICKVYRQYNDVKEDFENRCGKNPATLSKEEIEKIEQLRHQKETLHQHMLALLQKHNSARPNRPDFDPASYCPDAID